MKKCLFTLGGLLFFLLAAAQTPVAYYPFSGNANDAIGTSHGTVNGATLTTDRFGNANSAYSFDGVDDFIDIGSINFASNNYTISFWVCMNTTTTDNTVFSGADPTVLTNTFILTEINNGAGRFLHRNPAGTTGGIELSSVQTIPLNLWKFITCVKQETTLSYYVNGILDNTVTNAGVTNISSVIYIELGRLRNGANTFIRHLNGKLDELKIFNTALTLAQVQQEFSSSNQAQKPGSGSAMSFDGVDDFGDIPSTPNLNFGTSQDFVVDTWVKIPVSQNFTATTDNIILDKWGGFGSGSAYPFSIRIQNNGSPDANKITVVRTNDIGGGAAINSLNTMNDNKWHHIAFAKNGTVLSLYVDGVLNGTITDLLTGNTGNSSTVTVGKRNGADQQAYFTGSIDEIRIWNTALTQSEIRDRMCRKITSSDALYSNLVAYYNFDESSGTILFDGTINANNGTLANNPTRVTSGAPIGNASSHDYVNATKTTSLAHASGESFTVTSASGNPYGIQLYRVDEQPNTTSGINTLGASDKYFGVFQINGTAPQYTGVYNYTGNPAVTGATEPQLRLNKRTDNAAGSWSVLSILPNQTANTISVSGESTEYILGVSGSPLPLNLIYFNGSIQNGNTTLSWKTNNEINTLHFEIENSNGISAFTTIAVVQAQQLSSGSDYGTVHTNPFTNGSVQYYRLKMIDKNGRFTYSNIIRLTNSSGGTDLSIYPNPAAESISISSNKKQEAVLTNSAGQLITKIVLLKGSQTINISKLAAGIYFIKGETVTVKFIKQ